ncbi:acid phosphatase [Mycolicibacterium vaccae]|nr:acid phosphatase [Mycolicibacterium vaccae]
MGLDGHRENQRLVLLRHGETEWSKSGQHTSRTDLELTDEGRRQAAAAGQALAELQLANPFVITSPRRRAVSTAELAGLTVDEKSQLVAEWDYGSYEGLTTAQIRKSVPDWLVWTHGCPDGESVAQVRERADAAAESGRPMALPDCAGRVSHQGTRACLVRVPEYRAAAELRRSVGRPRM